MRWVPTTVPQSIKGFAIETVNEVNRLGVATIAQGGQIQAAKYAEYGAALRGGDAMAFGNGVRAEASKELATPTEDLYELSPIEKIGSQAIGLGLAADSLPTLATLAITKGPLVAARFGEVAGDIRGLFPARGTVAPLEDIGGSADALGSADTAPNVGFGHDPSASVNIERDDHVPFVDLLAPGDIAPGLYRADPAQIRFTQSDASPYFSKGGSINSLVEELRSGAVTADQVGDPLQVVIHHDLPFSIDNRRLVAFNIAGVDEVPIRVVSLEDPAIAARFFDRFDPIGGIGQNIVITPSSGRSASQMLLRDSGLIRGVQLGY